MSGLTALAMYNLSDEEESGKIVDSEEDERMEEVKPEKKELKEEKKPIKEEINHEQEDIWEEGLPKDEDDEEEEREDDDVSIKNVQDLSEVHNDSSDAEAAEGSTDGEGEENDDVSNLGNTLKITAKRRAKRRSSENAMELAKKLRSASDDEVMIPPEPEGRCSASLQGKISRFLERKVKHGEDLNHAIQARKDFRNPSIYEKLILYLGIEELGTNFPPDEYNPKIWRKAPAYDELARAQREDMSKREKERKTKVEFVTGTVKKPSSSSGHASGGSGEVVKKTKWDQQVHVSKVSSEKNVSSSSSSKPTVISAIGTIKKPKV